MQHPQYQVHQQPLPQQQIQQVQQVQAQSQLPEYYGRSPVQTRRLPPLQEGRNITNQSVELPITRATQEDRRINPMEESVARKYKALKRQQDISSQQGDDLRILHEKLRTFEAKIHDARFFEGSSLKEAWLRRINAQLDRKRKERLIQLYQSER
eukprot:TRINITY_DN17424_c0_g1_i2.p1 TRINITY_DN17424_c0_g1~~TRINITY_DN17424_c0_g1_i2.p1  ORF type:complete len:154 (+),score=20.30 TRINITY_DN17424_c0_g1_i2:247-708(+)